MPVMALDTTARLYGARCVIGEGFRAVSPGVLIEKGDEYWDASGRFVAYSLECIGQPIPADAVVRRLEVRSALRF